MEQDVVLCHHCHSKVHIVDFCNNKRTTAILGDKDEDDDEMDAAIE